MVTDVSAMFVAMTTLRTPGGGLENVSLCSSLLSVLCSGTSANLFSTSSSSANRRSCSARISAMPGRKIKMAPSSYSSAMSATSASMSSRLIFSSSTVCKHRSVASEYPGYEALVSSVTSSISDVRSSDSFAALEAFAAREDAPPAPPTPPERGLNVRRDPPATLFELKFASDPAAYSPSGSTTYPVASMASSRRYSATGNVRPGISIHPHVPGTSASKYRWNSSASTVALIATSRKSRLRVASERRMTSRKSLSKSRSCTSSTTTCVTSLKSGSLCKRLSKIPVVQKSKRVSLLTLLSSRMLYPTVAPIRSPRSAATRSATAIALSRRGCVTTTEHFAPLFA